MKKLLPLIFLFLFAWSIKAQNPEYYIEIKNDIQTSSSEYEFDVVIGPSGSTTSFELAALQMIFTYNEGINNGDLDLYVVSGSSELTSSQQPQQSKVSITENRLEVFPQTPPGDGDGTIIDSEKRVIRLKLVCTPEFAEQRADINWVLTGNPRSKVWAYVGTTNTNISNSSSHLNSMTNPVLPVELVSFTTNINENNVVALSWETATEVNNYGFDVERAVNNENKEWGKIGFVEGHGNSNSPKLYDFIDKNPIGGTNFVYRLKQIDIDGTYEYSDEVEIVIIPNKNILYQNYPNPFNPETLIRFSLMQPENVKIKLYNIMGEEVNSLTDEKYEAGYHEVKFNGSSLASGIYFYSIQTKNFAEVKKLLLMK